MGLSEGVPTLAARSCIRSRSWRALGTCFQSLVCRASRAADMNVLMTIAVAGSRGESGVVSRRPRCRSCSRFAGARVEWSVGRTRAVAKADGAGPATVRLRRPDEMSMRCGRRGEVGATLWCGPGAECRLDGRVTRASDEIDVTRFRSRARTPVSKARLGALCRHRSTATECLERPQKAASDTTLANIIHMGVGDARSRSGLPSNGREICAAIYRPVWHVAVAVLVAPPLMFGGAWSD